MGQADRSIDYESRVVVKARHVPGAPVLSVRVWLRAGSREEAIPGLALVTGRALVEGSSERDWRTVLEEAESRGIGIAGFGGAEAIGIAIDALAEDWELALEWAAELSLSPQFSADRVSWCTRRAAAELQSLGDQPEIVTEWAFLKQLYSPHPRARPLHGTVTSLARITRNDCRSFHQRALGRGVIVAAAGNVDEALLRARLEELFKESRGRAGSLGNPPAVQGLAESDLEVPIDSTDQAHLFLGHLTLPLKHPAVPALQVAAVVLGAGSGLTGRIPERVREQEGLAYSVGVDLLAGAGLDSGRFVVYVGTAPTNLRQAERSVIEEIDRLASSGITDQELSDAKSYLIWRDPFHRETARQWSDLLAESEYTAPLNPITGIVEVF
jgi:zinc protease